MNSLTNFYKRNKRLIDPHLVMIGGFVTAKFILQRSCSILRYLCRSPVDIVSRYGKGSYALITGGASGIGKAYAKDLAAKGFNIILLDFNKEALEQCKVELEAINKDLIVKLIQVDFSKGDNAQFYEDLRQQLSTFDISILVNNVGTGRGCFGYFHRIPIQHMVYGFNVNLITPIMMTSILINQLMLRNKYKSLILNLSSGSALEELPYFFSYGASKRALADYMEALRLELKDRKITHIDLLTLQPRYVSTALIGFKTGFFIITPEELVKNTWAYVGKQSVAVPHWKHNLLNYFTRDLLSNRMLIWLEKKIATESAENATRLCEQ